VVKDGYGTYSVNPGISGSTGKSPSILSLGSSEEVEQSETDSDHLDRLDRGSLSDAA
jgi:hypothetical protein